MNVAQHVERGRVFFPDKPALIAAGRTMSYRELGEAANHLANALIDLGICAGDRVALLLPNCVEFVYCYLGIQKAGAISVSISPLLKPPESSHILSDCGAKALISKESLASWVTASRPDLLEHVILIDGGAPGCLSLEQLCSKTSPAGRAVDLDGDTPSAILYTSGTTGFPKGAVLSHRNIVSNIYSKNHYCGMRPHDRLLLFLPVSHVFGQNAILNAGLNALATVVLCDGFEPEAVAAAISSNRVTMFFGVPTTYRLVLDSGVDIDLSTVRYYFSAAASLDIETAEEWRRRTGRVIHEGYGATETSPFACYNHEFRHKPGSVGTPIENVEVKVFRDSVEALPGEIGEIVVRGPNVMKGYWNRPEETDAALCGGWFHTGDLGFMDDQGYFFVVDRSKDMINAGGLKVYPAEVERVLRQHPSVADVAVYGVSSRVAGEEPRASIVLRPGCTLIEREILAFCRERLADFKVPAAIYAVEALPRSAAGKVLKQVLREQANALAPADSPKEVLTHVRR
jgi:long-chain acyl-CoA synthetase